MGGNALNFKVRRVEREEFLALQQEVIDIIKGVYPTVEIVPLISYRNKQSFGGKEEFIKKVLDNGSELTKLAVEREFKNKQNYGSNSL